MIQFDLRTFYKWFGLKPPTAFQCLVFGCFGDWGTGSHLSVKKLGWVGSCRGGVFTFYHGKSPFCTTIWDDMFVPGTFFQASWPCKSKWGFFWKKTIESVWLAQKTSFIQEWFNQPPTIVFNLQSPNISTVPTNRDTERYYTAAVWIRLGNQGNRRPSK